MVRADSVRHWWVFDTLMVMSAVVKRGKRADVGSKGMACGVQIPFACELADAQHGRTRRRVAMRKLARCGGARRPVAPLWSWSMCHSVTGNWVGGSSPSDRFKPLHPEKYAALEPTKMGWTRGLGRLSIVHQEHKAVMTSDVGRGGREC